jgi:hypothetical protein
MIETEARAEPDEKHKREHDGQEHVTYSMASFSSASIDGMGCMDSAPC